MDMEYLFAMYTERYAHTDMEKDGPVEYRPISIATTKEMQGILASAKTTDEALTMMHDLHGTPGPKIGRGKK